MAKSLRSKWKRKMRSVKRVKYGEKELKKLLSIVEISKQKEIARESAKDVEMKPIGSNKQTAEETESEPMTTNILEREASRSKKTLRDQFGQYPQWMNKREIKKRQKSGKLRLKNKRK
ncbi:protein LLP homolog [Oppia nitens]|uniref:protein LLP homolog n=1 Tax=Oppia nitens TaxID=1686743 RepID=UPI0023DA490C|nr:protein LLP homolog [Oppia nitens]